MKKERDIDLLICMNNFRALGAQRAIITLLNNWPTDNVALSVHNTEGKFESDLQSTTPVYQLDSIQPPIPGIRPPFRVFAFYKLLKKIQPKTVIAVNQFEALALTFVKRFYSDFRLIVSEHCHVSSNIHGPDRHRGWFGWYYRNFFKSEYNTYADAVHIVSYEAAADIIDNHGIDPNKVRIIYNPIDVEMIRSEASVPTDHPWLTDEYTTAITAVRHTSQKRLDILLEAWHQIRSQHSSQKQFRLIICGDGPQRTELEEMATRLGIYDTVSFTGFIDNPWALIQDADVFVSTSEWEGLPMSIIEAQALKTPIVSSDCPSGPKEILMNGKSGFLFSNKDVQSCVSVLSRALTDPTERKVRERLATKNICRFKINTVVEDYKKLVSAETTKKILPDSVPDYVRHQ